MVKKTQRKLAYTRGLKTKRKKLTKKPKQKSKIDETTARLLALGTVSAISGIASVYQDRQKHKQYELEQKRKAPWRCDYCESLNPAHALRCSTCNAPR